MSALFRIELYVSDIDQSLAFYQHVIGLNMQDRNDRCGRFNTEGFSLLVTSEEVLKKDHYFYRSNPTDDKGRGIEIIIVVEDAETVLNRCIDYGYALETKIVTYPWNMRGFNVVDPDGYYIRVTSP
ncbi:VOC family protein [Alkalicoccus luteus]|uniref:VOC family protein n=1 Tax=Alkalicoccus luteus TaxID=1237094 RepID=UPI004033D63C